MEIIKYAEMYFRGGSLKNIIIMEDYDLKITVLVDNNTFIDRYYLAEPAVSYYIETDDKNILFDLGYSDIFIKNAHKMGIDLKECDYIVLSHGHQDHTWGLEPLIKYYMEENQEKGFNTFPQIIAHPLTLQEKYYGDLPIGINVLPDIIDRMFDLKISKEPYWITDRLVFLGEIKRNISFETEKAIGYREDKGKIIEDYLLDDTALAYLSDEGIVIITGCSHSGICNIVETAKRICGENRVIDIIGGLHLLDSELDVLENTAAYLNKLNLKSLHACHCTDLKSKIILGRDIKLEEVGVGLQLRY